jgi:hypothetical protein
MIGINLLIQRDWKGRVQTDDCGRKGGGHIAGDSSGVRFWDGFKK